MLNEDMVNMGIRIFLKKVGVTSQEEIENALQAAAAAGRLDGSGSLKARMTLEVAGLGLGAYGRRGDRPGVARPVPVRCQT